MQKHDPRPEGLYLKFSDYDIGAGIDQNTPVVIERVNGDCSVSEFIIARDEAERLVGQLKEFLREAVPGPVSDDTIHHGPFPPVQIEAIDDREKTKRALDALDSLCDMWAEEVDLEHIVRVISGQPDKVRAMLRQSWIEGAFRGRTSAIDYPPREAAAPKPAPPPNYSGEPQPHPSNCVCADCCERAERATPAPGAERALPFRKVIEWLHHTLAAAQNTPYEDGDVCEDCTNTVLDGLVPLVREALAAAPPAPYHLEATLAAERKDCEKALLALAGWYPTPVETYGTNTSWAISDLCRAIRELRDRHASAERVRELIAKWRKEVKEDCPVSDKHSNFSCASCTQQLRDADELERALPPSTGGSRE